MFTYAIMNTVVMGALALVMRLWPRPVARRPVVYTLAALLVLTLVFDALIIAAGLVAYDTALVLPVRIINVPLEDFAYAVAAAVFVPYLWNVSAQSHEA